MPWTTEITHVVEPVFFVDEQRSGPYRLWHHQHIFAELDGHVKMTDLIHYQLGFGLAGLSKVFIDSDKWLGRGLARKGLPGAALAATRASRCLR